MAKFNFDENQEDDFQPRKKPGKQDMWAQNPRKKTKVNSIDFWTSYFKKNNVLINVMIRQRSMNRNYFVEIISVMLSPYSMM